VPRYKAEEVIDNVMHTLCIFQDTVVTNPREEFDNLGTMICWHRRYNLGDKHNYDSCPDFWEALGKEVGLEDIQDGFGVTDQQGEIIESKVVMLPLYLYDHSGITIRTTPFSCSWDSGQVGFIYVTYDRIKKEFGEVNEETKEMARKALLAEVEMYDFHLLGEVYGYKITKAKVCHTCGHIEQEEVDSCWGFYGLDWKKNGMKDQVEEKYHILFNKLQ
jgi:hypothetical protein